MNNNALVYELREEADRADLLALGATPLRASYYADVAYLNRRAADALEAK